MMYLETQARVEVPLKLEVVAQPAQEPVTYADLYNHLRLLTHADRDLVNALEIAGRSYVEARTRQTLITTTFDLWIDDFPVEILLPARPVQSVTYVKYYDQNNVQQTLDVSQYQVDTKGPRPRIIPPYGSFFPFPRVQKPNAVQVRFVAGFGDNPSDVPESFKTCIRQWVALNYDNREAVIMGKTPANVPHTFDYLMASCALPEV